VGCRPALDDAAHHLDHRRGDVLAHHPRRRRLPLFEHAPVAVEHAPDEVRSHAHAFIREGRVGRDHLGERGLGGAERFLLGSVSGALVKNAPCTVEVVRG
jgi:hypothetical protein